MMTIDEAKTVLSVWRPDGRDHADPDFREALEVARNDPALLEWLHDQQEFDSMMVNHLSPVLGPAEGRREILAQGGVVLRRRAAQRRGWVALAATVLIVAAVGWWRYISLLDPVLPEAPFTLAGAAEHLSVNHKSMEVYSENAGHLQAWLLGRGSPSPAQLPGRLAALKAYGAQDWRTSRGRVSLLCFYPDDAPYATGYGQEAEWLHLFVFPKRLARLEAAGGDAPQILEGNDWVFVVWREGETAYAVGLPAKQGARERLRNMAGV